MVKVLVLTNSRDGLNTDVVLGKITSSGHQVIRMDVDKVTSGEHQLMIMYQPGSTKAELATPKGRVELSTTIDSVWLRRPYEFDFRIDDEVQRKVAEEEVRDILEGLYEILEYKHWVSRPAAIRKARLKPYQMMLARRFGLMMPESLITNSPETARRFAESGATIFKPMAGYYFDYGDHSASGYATLLTDEHIAQFHLVANQPVLLQRFIRKKYELRATYAGGQFYTAKLETSDYASVIDWRTPENAEAVRYSVASLPPAVEEKLHRMVRYLDLQFGAIDLAVDAEGNHFFLEINPNGQWMWIEQETGLDISAGIAQSLTGRR